jgi:hypothetical protein
MFSVPLPSNSMMPPVEEGGRRQKVGQNLGFWAQRVSLSPSGFDPPGRGAPLLQHQGWVTLTQGHSQTEPQRLSQVGPDEPVLLGGFLEGLWRGLETEQSLSEFHSRN